MTSTRVIWKFHLHSPITDLLIPDGAFVLTAQVQNGDVVVWAELEPDEPKLPHRFYLVMTGRPIPNGATYIATVQIGPIVFHVYCGSAT